MSGLSSGVWHWPLVRGTSRRDSQTRASSSRGDFCLLILTPSIYDRSREMAAVHAAVFPLSHALSERGHETETREARSAKKPTGNPYTPRREFSRSKVKSHTPPPPPPKRQKAAASSVASSSAPSYLIFGLPVFFFLLFGVSGSTSCRATVRLYDCTTV